MSEPEVFDWAHPVKPIRKSPETPIVSGGVEIAQLEDFWSWGFSDLLNNALRGVLAEYLVGLALDCIDGATRIE